jgi:hypothetical protein
MTRAVVVDAPFSSLRALRPDEFLVAFRAFEAALQCLHEKDNRLDYRARYELAQFIADRVRRGEQDPALITVITLLHVENRVRSSACGT